MQAKQNMPNEKKAKYEAKATLFVYALYFLFSVGTAYILGANPDMYSYIFGFPAWFFYSCILSYPLACIAVFILIKRVFIKEDKA